MNSPNNERSLSLLFLVLFPLFLAACPNRVKCLFYPSLSLLLPPSHSQHPDCPIPIFMTLLFLRGFQKFCRRFHILILTVSLHLFPVIVTQYGYVFQLCQLCFNSRLSNDLHCYVVIRTSLKLKALQAGSTVKASYGVDPEGKHITLAVGGRRPQCFSCPKKTLYDFALRRRRLISLFCGICSFLFRASVHALIHCAARFIAIAFFVARKGRRKKDWKGNRMNRVTYQIS